MPIKLTNFNGMNRVEIEILDITHLIIGFFTLPVFLYMFTWFFFYEFLKIFISQNTQIHYFLYMLSVYALGIGCFISLFSIKRDARHLLVLVIITILAFIAWFYPPLINVQEFERDRIIKTIENAYIFLLGIIYFYMFIMWLLFQRKQNTGAASVKDKGLFEKVLNNIKSFILIVLVLFILFLIAKIFNMHDRVFTSLRCESTIAGSIAKTGQNGYIMSGDFQSFLYLINTNKTGGKKWAKVYKNIRAGNERGSSRNSIKRTTDGSFIVTGNMQAREKNDMQIFLMKINERGKTLWTKTPFVNGVCYGTYVDVTSENGYIVAGATLKKEDYHKTGDMFAIKTDMEGNTIWVKIILQKNFFSTSVHTANNGYLITGANAADVHTDKSAESCIVYLDPKGNEKWIIKHGGLIHCSVYVDDKYLISAGCKEKAGIFIIKSDEKGTFIWDKEYNELSNATSVVRTPDKGYIILGYSDKIAGNSKYKGACLLKIDEKGNKEWIKFLNDENCYMYGIKQADDGGYVIAGYKSVTITRDSEGFAYLIKVDKDGNRQW